jgi:hypothetical protein
MQPLTPSTPASKNLPPFERGMFYEFIYADVYSPMKTDQVMNPVIVFSHMDTRRFYNGVNIRLLAHPEFFIEDYKNLFVNGDTIKYMKTHPLAFSERALGVFKRNPDVYNAWRTYNPIFMKNVNPINIDDIKGTLRTNTITRTQAGIL